ncbi:MAG: DNA mismatch repair protein MutS, partial [Bacteroidota bacterium]|nr:DNA mismatch repair protein MutS [Bacteroidota bacterium]
MAKDIVKTPLMKQYNAIKAKHPDAILLFRVGDFYETFSKDAIRTSEILGITLTRRANGAASFIELAGFPHHALDTYLPKLVRAGQRVAVCEQLEDPKLTKKIVKRGVTELVTPGVSLNDNVLERRENNFLASV